MFMPHLPRARRFRTDAVRLALWLVVSLTACARTGFGSATSGSGGAGGAAGVGIDAIAAALQLDFPPPSAVFDGSALSARGRIANPLGVVAVRVNGVLASTSDGWTHFSATVPLGLGAQGVVIEVSDGVTTRVATASALVRRVPWAPHRLSHLALEPGGTHLRMMTTYPIDLRRLALATGAVTPLYVAPGVGWPVLNPGDFVADYAQQKTYFLADYEGAVHVLNEATGALTLVVDNNTGSGPTLGSMRGMALDSANQRLLIIDATRLGLVAVDLSNGARTVLSQAGVRGVGPELFEALDIAFAPGETRAFVVSDGHWQRRDAGATVYAIDLTTGDRTVVVDDTTASAQKLFWTTRVVHDPVGQQLFVGRNHGYDDNGVYRVDLVSGLVAGVSGNCFDWQAGSGVLLRDLQDLAFDEAGSRLLALDRAYGSVVAVDLATGARSLLIDPRLGAGDVFRLTAGAGFIDSAQDRLVIPDGGNFGTFARAVTVARTTGDRAVLMSDTVGSGYYPREIGGITADASGTATGRWLITDIGRKGIVALDSNTGARTVWSGFDGSGARIGLGPDFDTPVALASVPSGPWYVLDKGLRQIVRVAPASGDRTVVAEPTPTLALADPRDFAVDAAGSTAYVADFDLDGIVAVDLTTGVRRMLASDTVGSGPSLTGIHAILCDEPRGRLLAATHEGLLLSVTLRGATAGNRVTLSARSGTDRTSPRGVGIIGGYPSFVGFDAARDVSFLTFYEGSAVVAVDHVTGDRLIVSW
jgi:DNA-binding beta-propeller fold protein YncE